LLHRFFLQTKVWMPSTWVISYIINMLELWFHMISKINLFLSFHIPILRIFQQKPLIIDVRSAQVLWWCSRCSLFKFSALCFCFFDLCHVPTVVCAPGLSILITPLIFSNIYVNIYALSLKYKVYVYLADNRGMAP